MASGASIGERRIGRCKWFNVAKGWGFITPDDGGQDVFVHQSVIKMSGFRSLGDEEVVEFECQTSDKGLEATIVCGLEGLQCKGSNRRPISKKRFRKIRCYNCGEFANHIAAKCMMGPQPKRCHQCRAVDHLIADCPHRSASGTDDNKKINNKTNKSQTKKDNNNDDSSNSGSSNNDQASPSSPPSSSSSSSSAAAAAAAATAVPTPLASTTSHQKQQQYSGSNGGHVVDDDDDDQRGNSQPPPAQFQSQQSTSPKASSPNRGPMVIKHLAINNNNNNNTNSNSNNNNNNNNNNLIHSVKSVYHQLQNGASVSPTTSSMSKTLTTTTTTTTTTTASSSTYGIIN